MRDNVHAAAGSEGKNVHVVVLCHHGNVTQNLVTLHHGDLQPPALQAQHDGVTALEVRQKRPDCLPVLGRHVALNVQAWL